MAEGIRFVRTRPVVLGAISLDLFAVLLGGAVALLPAFARDILHVGPVGLGLLRSAPAVGAALTAIAFGRRPLERHAGRMMFGAVAVFGLSTIVFGLSTSFYLSLAALFVLGASDMVSVFIRTSLIQMATPDAMRGRVSVGEHAVHRRLQRAGRIRIRHHRSVVGHGAGGDRRRAGHAGRGRAVDVGLPAAAQGRPADAMSAAD